MVAELFVKKGCARYPLRGTCNLSQQVDTTGIIFIMNKFFNAA